MSGKVPPSQRAYQRTRGLSQARGRYERFTGNEAREIGRLDVAPMPKEVACIGIVTGLMYATDRNGKRQDFVHEFAEKDAPMLCVSPDGKRIFLLEGNYKFTYRGIVDKSFKG